MNDDVRIDRLVLDLPGLSEAEARELAALVGEALASVAATDRARLSLSIDRQPGEPTGRLAARIVSQLLRQMA